MAARSIAKTESGGKSRSAIQEHLKNLEVPFAFGLLFADAILVSLIIAYVPCKDRTPFLFMFILLSTQVIDSSNFPFSFLIY